MKVIGIRRIDLENGDNSYHGYKYYCCEEVDGVAGYATDSFTVSDRLASTLPRDIALDDEVIPVYKKDSHTLRTVIFM